MIAAASGFSSPTTIGCPRRKRTLSCTCGAVTSARLTVVLKAMLTVSLPARSRCAPVKECRTRLTGVLAATQGNRLRVHHRPRIRQLRTENNPAYSLSKIAISEVSLRFNDPDHYDHHLICTRMSRTRVTLLRWFSIAFWLLETNSHWVFRMFRYRMFHSLALTF